MKEHLNLSVSPAVRALLQAQADNLGISISALVSMFAKRNHAKTPKRTPLQAMRDLGLGEFMKEEKQ